MEHNRTAGKSKINKHAAGKKLHLIVSAGSGVLNVNDLKYNSTLGLKKAVNTNSDITLTIDNSLSRYANEKFIVEHTKNVDKKFAAKKQKA